MRMYLLLIAAVLVSGLAAMVPFAWSGAEVFAAFYRDASARELESNARLLALALPPAIEDGGRAELSEMLTKARADSDTRYTLILRDGTVVADSDEEAGRMENHLNRPEVKEALAGGMGIGIRASPTLGTEWIYVATPLVDGNVVRAAASMEELNRRLGQWLKKALIGFAVSLAVLAAMALFVSRRISRPVEAAAACAERYADGDFSHRPPLAGAAEMRRLSASMGLMAVQLDARFRLVNRQREEMQAVFENMAEGILAVDDMGQVMLVNSAALTMLDLDRDISGLVVESAIRNADLLDGIRETRTTGAPVEKEIRIPRDAGDESLIHVHTARICEEGEEVGVLAVLRDVARIRRLETMRRDFVANVSHELRTPITTIQSCIETVLDDADGECGSGEFLEMALRNTRRMGAIIDNLLFLAGMESGMVGDAGKIDVNPVRPVLDEAAALCREDARERNTAIVVDCGNDLTALMNNQLIVHAVVNLVDNAIKYGPENGKISVAAVRDGDRTFITVSDQGPGIASRHRERVFERFYRGEGSIRIKKGSGLGLAIVKHIALSQGGDIGLESEIGAGSRFILSLPAG